ncbi:hypothetical protein GE09DRAFT_118207 [Coniochaeta sp. 2T2.1]|nr:hypothetical protein GE09DRAFT_118207 [Coniochaeta sp. 2T2.1]
MQLHLDQVHLISSDDWHPHIAGFCSVRRDAHLVLPVALSSQRCSHQDYDDRSVCPRKQDWHHKVCIVFRKGDMPCVERRHVRGRPISQSKWAPRTAVRHPVTDEPTGPPCPSGWLHRSSSTRGDMLGVTSFSGRGIPRQFHRLARMSRARTSRWIYSRSKKGGRS